MVEYWTAAATRRDRSRDLEKFVSVDLADVAHDSLRKRALQSLWVAYSVNNVSSG